jgi:two-component system sensor histidine kinase SenX3
MKCVAHGHMLSRVAVVLEVVSERYLNVALRLGAGAPKWRPDRASMPRNLYDEGVVIRRRRLTSQPQPPGRIPEGILDVLQILDAEFLILTAGEVVLSASKGIDALSLVREGRLSSPPMLTLVRAVRRSNQYQEATLVLPRGPIGEGTHDVLVRVSRLGSHDLVLALIFDDSEFRRLDAIRRDFVANISHELKTPIGALSILSEAALEASEDPEAIVRFATRMQMEAKRLSDLVQEIINLSRLQDDDPLKNAKVLDLSVLIGEAIEDSRLAAEARHISLIYSNKRNLQVLGDRSQIEMAIRNLIENAINYSPDGTRVAIALVESDGLAEISISDQGLGIPEKEIDRIFERFYRVDPARSRMTGGTGLGLSIVKHVVTNHGGDISVWSVEGSGSTFTIRLPLYSPKEIIQSHTSQTEEK